MATSRSFTDAYKVVDVTPTLLRIPNQWSLVTDMNVFTEESVAQNSIQFEQVDSSISIVNDQHRGARNAVNSDRTRKIHAFSLTHHPLDDYLTGQDIGGVRAYGSTDQAETEQAATLRKLEDMARKHDATLETARVHTLVTGTQFAPNGTVSANFYTDFGITRKETDFLLGTAGTEINEKAEEGIAHIQDNLLSGMTAGGMVALCSPTFFAKLIKHAKIVDAYKFYSSTQEPLRNRLGGADALYRRFVFGGVEYIEYRGSFNGTALIPANEARLMPTNVPGFAQTFYGPSSKLSHVNTLGEKRYGFTYRDPKDEFVEIQTETNFLNLIKYPQAIVRLHTSN